MDPAYPHVPRPLGRVARAVADAAIDAAAQRYRCDRQGILNGDRSRPWCHARQYAMWLLRQRLRDDGWPVYSLPAVARAVGLKDHTTACHAITMIESRGEAVL